MTCPLCQDPSHSLSQCPRWMASKPIEIPIFMKFKLKNTEIKSMTQDIVDFLKNANGENYGVEQISRAMNVGQAGMSKILRAMEDDGLIRGIHGIKQPRYSVPTKEQLQKEDLINKPKEFKPLKIDKRKLEIYAELKMARESIKSNYGNIA